MGQARKSIFLYAGAFMAMAVILLAGATMRRNTLWKSEITILRDAVVKSPRKERLHYNLGTALARDGLYREALVHFTEALAMNPHRSEYHNQTANIYFILGRKEAAIEEWKTAIGQDEKNLEAVYNLAQALYSGGKRNEALVYYQKFIRDAGVAYADQIESARRRVGEIPK